MKVTPAKIYEPHAQPLESEDELDFISDLLANGDISPDEAIDCL